MASMPNGRMGPPPRSLATDAYDCIMVWIPRGIHRIQGCGDDDRYDLAGSPQIVLSVAVKGGGACGRAGGDAYRIIPRDVVSRHMGISTAMDKTRINRSRNGQTPLLLGARFRRQPLAPSGATLRALGVDRSARPSKGVCRAINAELRSHEPGASGDRSVWRTSRLTTKAPYKDGADRTKGCRETASGTELLGEFLLPLPACCRACGKRKWEVRAST
jgi:hypothetical protein